jgi:hypothetical protein
MSARPAFARALSGAALRGHVTWCTCALVPPDRFCLQPPSSACLLAVGNFDTAGGGLVLRECGETEEGLLGPPP